MDVRERTRFIVRGHRDRSFNIAVVGGLDGSSVNSLRYLLHELEPGRVTLDLTECTAVSDDAATVLADAARAAGGHGGSLSIRPSATRPVPPDIVLTEDQPPWACRELSRNECDELLAKETIGRVAVNRNGVPHVMPVNYLWMDGIVVFRSLPGFEISTAQQGQPVSFEVDGIDPQLKVGWSVLVSGRTMLITDGPIATRAAGHLDSWAAHDLDPLVGIAADLVSGRELQRTTTESEVNATPWTDWALRV